MIESLFEYLKVYFDDFYYEMRIIEPAIPASILKPVFTIKGPVGIEILFESHNDNEAGHFVEALESLNNKGIRLVYDVDDISKVTYMGNDGPHHSIKAFIDASNLNENTIKSLTAIDKFNL